MDSQNKNKLSTYCINNRQYAK